MRIDMLMQGLADVIETIKAGRSGVEVEPCIERLQTLHVVSVYSNTAICIVSQLINRKQISNICD
jgi:hypothetical protein